MDFEKETWDLLNLCSEENDRSSFRKTLKLLCTDFLGYTTVDFYDSQYVQSNVMNLNDGVRILQLGYPASIPLEQVIEFVSNLGCRP